MVKDMDETALDLVRKMLVYDPLRRISPGEALNHPYFKGVSDPTAVTAPMIP